MARKTHIADLPEFDMARQLKNEEDIAAYVTMVIEDGDAAELAHALGVAAKGTRNERNCTGYRSYPRGTVRCLNQMRSHVLTL